MKRKVIAALVMALPAVAGAQTLPGTAPLEAESDFAAEMVAGIDRFLMRETEASASGRSANWKRDFTSPQAYARSVEPNRERFRKLIGAVDERLPPALWTLGAGDAVLARGNGFRVYAVRWSALPGVEGEGLLLLPDRAPIADVVVLPDCDNTPEQLAGLEQGIGREAQFARRLAETGCRVLVPVLMDRKDTWSGLPGVRMTNQPHREYLYRAAFEMGRHIIGYEVQKVMSAVDWFRDTAPGRRVGVVGVGEGGLIGFYAAALDTRIDGAAIAGYFGPREGLWREPIYRNVFGLLREFGDAEIAGLIAPRGLEIIDDLYPETAGPQPRPNRTGAAPGALGRVNPEQLRRELGRAANPVRSPTLANAANGEVDALPPFRALRIVPDEGGGRRRFVRYFGAPVNPEERMKRQFTQILEHTQRVMRESARERERLWSAVDTSSVEKYRETLAPLRAKLWEEVIGKLPPASLPPNPRSRQIYDEPKYRGYEVVLDVYPGVLAYGILLVPKDLKEGERRPVVVCQHGLEGRPQDVADPKVDHPAYHRYACRLAERGFVVFAPQNPYIGGDRFRVLQRKANPLGLSLFSFIVRQHERILEWLGSLPFVDRERIAFYGLSYGGKTAMRVPALLEGYCLSICSADYNEWIWKNVRADSSYSYLLTNEYEMPEWNLGNTFNYAEMSWLICPRPFMVERGHDDGVAPDEWVAYEYARTRRRYVKLGIGDRTEIEFFDGPHTIHGVGTFAFLHNWLRWPVPAR